MQSKVFSEHVEAGAAAVTTALLNKSKAFELEERVHLIVMDVRGWADLHPEASGPNAKDLAKGMKSAAEGVMPEEENGTKAAPANKDFADGVAAAGEAVTKGEIPTRTVDLSQGHELAVLKLEIHTSTCPTPYGLAPPWKTGI